MLRLLQPLFAVLAGSTESDLARMVEYLKAENRILRDKLWRSILCAVVLTLLGSSARGDEAEDKAAALVVKLGGKVIRDEKAPGKPVVGVDLFDTRATDADLEGLVAFKNLTDLRLNFTKIADLGLKELSAFKSLAKLELTQTEVTDAGVKELTALKSLTELRLGGTKVTDTSLKELSR